MTKAKESAMRFDLVDLQLFVAVADTGSITAGALRAAGDAAGIGHRDEKLEVDQVETHGVFGRLPAFVMAEGLVNQ